MHSKERICRVCGHVYPGYMWEDANTPSHGICLCCGNQAGLTDVEEADVEWFFANWRNTGFRFHDLDYCIRRDIDPLEQRQNLHEKIIKEIILEIAFTLEIDFTNAEYQGHGLLLIDRLIRGINGRVDIDDRGPIAELFCELDSLLEINNNPQYDDLRAARGGDSRPTIMI
ncbi:hypothetical protein [Salinarimonas sp.]|uniref:hypothetical protein n=1 Tax=Salinarimonas sp. TaxID=2766526 RepID=UPI003919555E